ncbi:hypothetical protein M758_10G011200 [Ceratodon purpureus]|nr:hypothetical protein M758_10G011200 [Ceratodon purpureus]
MILFLEFFWSFLDFSRFFLGLFVCFFFLFSCGLWLDVLFSVLVLVSRLDGEGKCGVSSCVGFMCGVAGGSFWKVHHMNERRKTEEFYARLEAGEITVQAQE